MAKIKTTQRLKKGDCEAALLRAEKLLKKLEKKQTIGKEDALEVKLLNDIIRALTNLAKSSAAPRKAVDQKKDAEVIERFFKRRKDRK